MNAAVKTFIEKQGYTVNENAYQIINACDEWYRAKETDAHQRITVNGERYSMERMGFGARAASDDANLCELVEINAGGNSEAQFGFVNDLLRANRFDVQFRRQLAMTSAEGTAACYVRLEGADVLTDGSVSGGRIRLNYVDAGGVIPLTVVNDEVIETGFWGESMEGGKKRTTVVLYTLDGGKYRCRARVFDENDREMPELAQDFLLGEVRPFAVLHTAQVNTFESMDGFGLPKLHGVIPILRGLDAAFTVLMRDIDSAEKMVLINETLCDFSDEDGQPMKANHEMKKRFVFLGEKLPDQKDVIQEVNPEIRIEQLQGTVELLLNLLSEKFGYGSKKYSFDPDTRAITTATQYVGERQDMLLELNRQRRQTTEYITGIVKAILWFANTYQGGGWDENVEVLVEYDDSYVTDEASELNEMRNDIGMGIGGAYVRQQYLMRKYNLTETEAMKWARNEDADAQSEQED